MQNIDRPLFRGKRIDNGEWVEGCHVDGYIVNYIDLATSWTPSTSDHKLKVRAFAVNSSTVGLQIYNIGKTQVFEGDLFKISFGIGNENQLFTAIYQAELPQIRQGFVLRCVKLLTHKETYLNITLALDKDFWLDANGDIHINESWGENEVLRTRWIERHYSKDVVRVGNYFDNPELLTPKS